MEKLTTVIILAAVFSAGLCAQQFDNVEQGKKQLSQIQSRMDQQKKQLEEYKRQERDINRYMSFLKKQQEQAQTKNKQLSKEISQAQKKMNDTSKRLKSLEDATKQWSRAMSGESSQYVLRKAADFKYYDTGTIVADMFLKAAITRKIVLLRKLEGESVRARQKEDELEKTSKSLSEASKKVQKDIESKQRSYNEKMVSLNATHEKYEKALQELEDLKKSAKSLNAFLENFEKKHTVKKLESKETLPIPRNSLGWPVSGRVISEFGKEELPNLKTYIVHEGIKIGANRGSPVRSVLDGQVIYAGQFKSYGNVVIVDHKKGFFTIYGFLDRISVSKDAEVNETTVIGESGMDRQSVAAGGSGDQVGALYFEIRAGSKAVDPERWLRKH